jgi:hypothetical protein
MIVGNIFEECFIKFIFSKVEYTLIEFEKIQELDFR